MFLDLIPWDFVPDFLKRNMTIIFQRLSLQHTQRLHFKLLGHHYVIRDRKYDGKTKEWLEQRRIPPNHDCP